VSASGFEWGAIISAHGSTLLYIIQYASSFILLPSHHPSTHTLYLHRVVRPLFIVVGFSKSWRERERLAAVGFGGFFDVTRVVFLPVGWVAVRVVVIKKKKKKKN
jgi:hypothetical protein